MKQGKNFVKRFVRFLGNGVSETILLRFTDLYCTLLANYEMLLQTALGTTSLVGFVQRLCPYFVLKAQLRSAHVHFGNPDMVNDYFRGKIQNCLCKNGPFCMLAIGAVFLLSAMFGVEALLSSCLHYSSPREIFSYYPALGKVL